MSARRAPNCRCPACGARIAESDLLIEYETEDGPAAYASCPSCDGVVQPVDPRDDAASEG